MIAFAPDETTDQSGKFVVAANKGLLKNKTRPNLDLQINNIDDLTEELLQSKFKDN